MLREEGGGGVEEGSRVTCGVNDVDVQYMIRCTVLHWQWAIRR